MNIIPPYTKWFSGFSIPEAPSPVTPAVAAGQTVPFPSVVKPTKRKRVAFRMRGSAERTRHRDLIAVITRFSVLLLNLSVVCLAGCVAANEEIPSEAVAERGIKMHGNNVNVYLGDASIFLNTVRKAERIRIGFATRHLGCDADTFAYDVSPTEFLAIQQAFLDSKTVYDEEYWIARDYDLDVDKSSRTRRDGPYIAVLFCDQNGNTLRSLRIELISDHQGTTFDYYSGKEVPEFWVVMTESHFRAVMHIVEKYRRISSALNQD